ncbi:MAG: RecX family transcriptional regulator [Deltaproteobacteria bacterium]|nr:RecX family transcriptional regulator [Deltaproteobacteria bacterium]
MSQPRRPVDERYLRNAINRYLDRWFTSSPHLHRLMMERVRASASLYGTDPVEGEAMLRRVIADLVERGVLDDRGYARARAQVLRQRGASERAVRASLAEKGLRGPLIDEVLAEVDGEEAVDSELLAAITWARKRGLGPYRTGQREEHRQRDLGRMGRKGFSYAVASKVLSAQDPEALEALLER